MMTADTSIQIDLFCFVSFFSGVFDFRVGTNDVNGLRSASFERLLRDSFSEVKQEKI